MRPHIPQNANALFLVRLADQCALLEGQHLTVAHDRQQLTQQKAQLRLQRAALLCQRRKIQERQRAPVPPPAESHD